MSHDRRSFLKSTAIAGTAGLLGAALGPHAARAAMGKGSDVVSMHADGTYDVVPLAKPVIALGVVSAWRASDHWLSRLSRPCTPGRANGSRHPAVARSY